MTNKSLDAIVCKEIADISQQLTHTGEKDLDLNVLNKLENLCKKSDAHMEHAYNSLMVFLEKKHSEIRYGTLLVCDHLFRRYSFFRQKLIGNLQEFMQFSIGTRKEHPLPPPKAAATLLRNRALKAISDWYHQFKFWHLELESAYDYLKDCLNVDFKAMEQQRLMEIRLQREEKKRLERIEKEKLTKTLNDIKECFDEITASVASMDSCMSLLRPPPEEFFLPTCEDMATSKHTTNCSTNEKDDDVEMREYGVIDPKQTVSFTLPSGPSKFKVNKDNYPIVENARDFYKQMERQYLPKLKLWMKVLNKSSGKDGQRQAVCELLEQAERVVRQYNELGIQEVSQKPQSDDSDDSDEMEEVSPKEGYETEVKDAMLAEMVRAHVERREEEKKEKMIQQSVASSSPVPQPGPSKITCKPKPALPRNIEDWEKKDIPKPHVVVGMKLDNHQVWLSSSALETEEVQIPTLESCPVEYTTDFVPVQWACRALLPSGKLCPRQDRVKCPLHGPIVPRDKQGKCSRPEDAKAEAEREEQHRIQNPDWQDPKLLEEIKKNTGIDLKMPEKGKRKKKAPEFPGLTDLKRKKDTPHSRLAKKIFKRGDLKHLMAASSSKEDDVILDDENE